MNIIRRSPHLFVMVVSGIFMLLFLSLTNPENVSIGLLIVPVVLLFLFGYGAAQALVGGLNLFDGQPRKRRTISLIGASFATVLMILQSTGGISGIDVILLGLIILIVTVYINKF